MRKTGLLLERDGYAHFGPFSAGNAADPELATEQCGALAHPGKNGDEEQCRADALRDAESVGGIEGNWWGFLGRCLRLLPTNAPRRRASTLGTVNELSELRALPPELIHG